MTIQRKHSTRTPAEPAARQLERRHAGAVRCEPMQQDSRRDPHRPLRTEEPPDDRELTAAAAAQMHLRSVGLTGLPSPRIRRAWAARPDRYASVLPRWPAA